MNPPKFENVIVKKAKSFEQAFAEVKTHLERKRKIRDTQKMLRELLEADDQYFTVVKDARDTAKEQRRLKKKLMQVPKMQSLAEKIESLKDEQDGHQLFLFSALKAYQDETGYSRLIDEESKTKFAIERKYKVKEER